MRKAIESLFCVFMFVGLSVSQAMPSRDEISKKRTDIESLLSSKVSAEVKVTALMAFHVLIAQRADKAPTKAAKSEDRAENLAYIMEDEALKTLDLESYSETTQWCDEKKNSLQSGFNPTTENPKELPQVVLWVYMRLSDLCNSIK